MAQLLPTDFPIDPVTTSGTQLSDILNRLMQAIDTNHSGAARPPYLKPGGMWTKTPAANAFHLMWFDGTSDREICKTVAGVFTAAGGGAFLPLTGGTLTGALHVKGDIDATGNVTGYKP